MKNWISETFEWREWNRVERNGEETISPQRLASQFLFQFDQRIIQLLIFTKASLFVYLFSKKVCFFQTRTFFRVINKSESSKKFTTFKRIFWHLSVFQALHAILLVVTSIRVVIRWKSWVVCMLFTAFAGTLKSTENTKDSVRTHSNNG